MHIVMCSLLLPPLGLTVLQPHVDDFQTRAFALVSCQVNVSNSVLARGLQRQRAESNHTQECTGCHLWFSHTIQAEKFQQT